jgi:alkylhydroperoxidase/carboxymuconolactone decarboxylase family protein YurZ
LTSLRVVFSNMLAGERGRFAEAPARDIWRRDRRRAMLDSRSIPRAKEDLSMSTMKEFAGLYYREGALDPKTLQLVALAAMAAAGCTS